VVQCDVCRELSEEVRGPHETRDEAEAALNSHEGAAGWQDTVITECKFDTTWTDMARRLRTRYRLEPWERLAEVPLVRFVVNLGQAFLGGPHRLDHIQ
jgi:hypothetical protein